MKHIKLFEEIKLKPSEFPYGGHDLSRRERIILRDLVGDFLHRFYIIVEDYYYYTSLDEYYNLFDSFADLKDYVLSMYYMYFTCDRDDMEKLLKNTRLDPSFDNNITIQWANIHGHKEIVKLLIKDERVTSKLTDSEINKYNKIITE